MDGLLLPNMLFTSNRVNVFMESGLCNYTNVGVECYPDIIVVISIQTTPFACWCLYFYLCCSLSVWQLTWTSDAYSTAIFWISKRGSGSMWISTSSRLSGFWLCQGEIYKDNLKSGTNKSWLLLILHRY